MLDAFLSSSEETKFGEILEEIAIAVCRVSRQGRKSGITGVDIEYDLDSERTLIQIKSSRKWGNADQHKKLVDDFQSATRVIRQGSHINVRCIEGICYGPSEVKDRGTHLRLIGTEFWEDLCGWRDAGRYILSVIGEHAGNGLHELRSRAVQDLADCFQHAGVSSEDGLIDWGRYFDLVMTPVRDRPR